jgi:N6-adenosine-specific RNA methylase IME4
MEKHNAIIIDSEFKALIPPLERSEIDLLEASLLNEGCRDALIVWEYEGAHILIDGHHRLEICNRHDIPYAVLSMQFATRYAVIEWMVKNQLAQRNLSPTAKKLVIARQQEAWKKEQGGDKGTERGEDGKFTANLQNASLRLDDEPSNETADKIAKQHGIEKTSVYRYGKLLKAVNAIKEIYGEEIWLKIISKEGLKVGKEGDQRRLTDKELRQWYGVYAGNTKRQPEPEVAIGLLDEILAGNANSWKQAVKIARKEERKAEIETIAKQEAIKPNGLFDVIVIDPPWPYGTEYDPDGRRVANPYPEMSLAEITEIKLPAQQDCILWLWTTHKFMRHSFALLDAWGFEEKAIVTWDKGRIGIGHWMRSQSEFCIMAVKGKPVVNLTNQGTVLKGAAREHSRKPEEFYSMVNDLCVGRKLDYFSRNERKNWEVYGNEPQHYSSV